MRYIKYTFLIIIFLSGCLEEQLNPLKTTVRPNCFDGILNQDEEDIDCGGICNACPEPIVSPCTNDLADNTLTSEWFMSDMEFFVECGVGTSSQYEVNGIGPAGDIYIRFSEEELPIEDKIYQITNSASSYDTDRASIRVVLAYSFSSAFQSGSGELYVTFKNEIPTFEFCNITLRNNASEIQVSGSLTCN